MKKAIKKISKPRFQTHCHEIKEVDDSSSLSGNLEIDQKLYDNR